LPLWHTQLYKFTFYCVISGGTKGTRMGASTKVLGELHEAVATALSEQVKGFTVIEDEQEKVVRPSPALLGAAIAFLKNNNITADANDNAALRELGETLKARRQRKLPQQLLDQAADSFAERFGQGDMMQ
jgi:hypothetical protein